MSKVYQRNIERAGEVENFSKICLRYTKEILRELVRSKICLKYTKEILRDLVEVAYFSKIYLRYTKEILRSFFLKFIVEVEYCTEVYLYCCSISLVQLIVEVDDLYCSIALLLHIFRSLSVCISLVSLSLKYIICVYISCCSLLKIRSS